MKNMFMITLVVYTFFLDFSGFTLALRPAIGGNLRLSLLSAKQAATLSPVCRLILGNDPPYGYAVQSNPLINQPGYQMAKGVDSFHHWCWAEVSMQNFFTEKEKQKRKFYLTTAADDYGFLIEHPEYHPKDWPFLSQVYVARAKAFKYLRKYNNAIADLKQALIIEKTNASAYSLLSDIFARKGDKDTALKIINEGLKYQPSSAGLKRRHERLTGHKSQ